MTDLPADTLLHALAMDERVRIVACAATHAVAEGCRIQGTHPTASAAFGRLLAGSALLAATLKGRERVTLQIRGTGPLQWLLARSTPDGSVHGAVGQAAVHLPPRPDGKLDVGAAVGQGVLVVTRDLGIGEPWTGTVPLATGEVGDDLAAYLLQSEQIHSAVGVGVLLRGEGEVTGAGGFLLQILGGLEDDEVDDLEAAIAGVRELARAFEGGMQPRELIHALVGDDHRVLAERPLRYHCPHDAEHYRGRLLLLGHAALEELLSEQPDLRVRCEFSQREYCYTRADFPELDRD